MWKRGAGRAKIWGVGGGGSFIAPHMNAEGTGVPCGDNHAVFRYQEMELFARVGVQAATCVANLNERAQHTEPIQARIEHEKGCAENVGGQIRRGG